MLRHHACSTHALLVLPRRESVRNSAFQLASAVHRAILRTM
jgi:hypothetical protein